jgi:hypothetical protein
MGSLLTAWVTNGFSRIAPYAGMIAPYAGMIAPHTCLILSLAEFVGFLLAVVALC